MQNYRTLAFGAVLLCAQALAAPVTEKDLSDCKLEALDAGAEDSLKGQDIAGLFTKDNFQSFLLKTWAPHLMKDKVLFWQEWVTCSTIKDENPEEWAACLRPHLNKVEAKYFESYLGCLKKKNIKVKK